MYVYVCTYVSKYVTMYVSMYVCTVRNIMASHWTKTGHKYHLTEHALNKSVTMAGKKTIWCVHIGARLANSKFK